MYKVVTFRTDCYDSSSRQEFVCRDLDKTRKVVGKCSTDTKIKIVVYRLDGKYRKRKWLQVKIHAVLAAARDRDADRPMVRCPELEE